MKKNELAIESNAVLQPVHASKLEVNFPPKGGIMRMGRHIFKDQEDFLSYLAEIFPVQKDDCGHRFSIKRQGKYDRVDKKGNRIFTFGDPVLDIITDEQGLLTIGNVRHDLHALELANPGSRGGGIHGIDLTPKPGELEHVLGMASAGIADIAIVEAHTDHTILASQNRSTLTFYKGNAKMRFRSFMKNYLIGWKMGTEIETWHGDFKRAEIQSNYGFWVYGRVCGVAKRDSDHDTNDDYVDEYEWGIASPTPNGVTSRCTATWLGQDYAGYVGTGSCDYWLAS